MSAFDMPARNSARIFSDLVGRPLICSSEMGIVVDLLVGFDMRSTKAAIGARAIRFRTLGGAVDRLLVARENVCCDRSPELGL